MFNAFQGFLDGPVPADYSVDYSMNSSQTQMKNDHLGFDATINTQPEMDYNSTLMFEDRYLLQKEEELSFNNSNNKQVLQETKEFGTTGSSLNKKNGETFSSARRAAESKKSTKELSEEAEIKELRQTP